MSHYVWIKLIKFPSIIYWSDACRLGVVSWVALSVVLSGSEINSEIAGVNYVS